MMLESAIGDAESHGLQTDEAKRKLADAKRVESELQASRKSQAASCQLQFTSWVESELQASRKSQVTC